MHLLQNVLKKAPVSTSLMMNQTALDMILCVLIGVFSVTSSAQVKQKPGKVLVPQIASLPEGC